MPAVLLRLLLIATLVLNGSGAAMASTRMVQQLAATSIDELASTPTRAARDAGPDVAPAHQSARGQAAPPCHEMAGMPRVADAAPIATIAHPASAAGQPRAHPSSPSHCDGDSCRCACLQLAQAMTTHPRVPALAAGATTMPPPGIDAHADPALPHLIRPPIA